MPTGRHDGRPPRKLARGLAPGWEKTTGCNRAFVFLRSAMMRVALSVTTTVSNWIKALKGVARLYGVSHHYAFCRSETIPPGTVWIPGLDGGARGGDGIAVSQPQAQGQG